MYWDVGGGAKPTFNDLIRGENNPIICQICMGNLGITIPREGGQYSSMENHTTCYNQQYPIQMHELWQRIATKGGAKPSPRSEMKVTLPF